MAPSQAMIRFEERITAACRSGEITQEHLDTLPSSPLRRFGENCLKVFREHDAERLADDTPDAGSPLPIPPHPLPPSVCDRPKGAMTDAASLRSVDVWSP